MFFEISTFAVTSATCSSEAAVPSVSRHGLAAYFLTILRFLLRFASDFGGKIRCISFKRNDLYKRCTALNDVEAVIRRGEEREMDFGMICIGINDAGNDLEDSIRAIKERQEQTTPAGFGSDRPVVMEFRWRRGLSRIACNLVGSMIADHGAVEVPAAINLPTTI